MQQDLLQTDMTDKTEAARRFLEEALADFRKGRLQEAAEKMTVSGTLVREMIGFIKWEELNRPVQITADSTFRHRPERHVMWYELKEKYLPEREHRSRSLNTEETVNTEKTAGALPEKIPERETRQEVLLSKACIEELGLSLRAENCLHRVGIETIGQLTAKTAGELRMIRNFGQKCLAEVREKLAEKNLTLREEENGDKT